MSKKKRTETKIQKPPPPFVIYPDLVVDVDKFLYRLTYSISSREYVFTNNETFREEFPVDLERTLVIDENTFTLRRGSEVLRTLEGVTYFQYLTNRLLLVVDTEERVRIIDEGFEVIAEGKQTIRIAPYDQVSASGNSILFTGDDGAMLIYSLRPFSQVIEREDIAGAAFIGKYLVTVKMGKDHHQLILESWNPDAPPASGGGKVVSISDPLPPVWYKITILNSESFLLHERREEGGETTLWSVNHGVLTKEQVFRGDPVRIGENSFIVGHVLMMKSSEVSSEKYSRVQTIHGDYSLRYPPKKKRKEVARSLMTPETKIPLTVVEIIVDFCVEKILPADPISSD